MYDNAQLKAADQNIKLYIFVRIFAKRVFLPLSAIYFIANSGFTIQSIGVLATFFALVQLFSELPTGYFADKFGRVASIKIGAFMNVVATLLYVTVHNKTGVFIGTFLEAMGYCFLNGSGEALVHDSLVVKDKLAQYTKILSKAQSTSLLINAVIVGLVPMTYKIDNRLPFLIGSFAYLSLFTFAFFMKDLKIAKVKKVTSEGTKLKRLFELRKLIGYGLLFGLVASFMTGPTDFVNLAFKQYGLKPEYLGWLFSFASVAGALFGRFSYKLKQMKPRNFLVIDAVSILMIYLAIFTQSIPFMVVAFTLSMVSFRFRRIVYSDYLLGLYNTNYKAVLLSGMSYVEELHLLWVPLAASYLISKYGMSQGFGIMGMVGLVVLPIFIYMSLRLLSGKVEDSAAHPTTTS